MKKTVVDLLSQQIDAGGTIIGLDTEMMSKHDKLAVRTRRVLELRRTEMEEVEVSVPTGKLADLRALWITASGHMVLTSMRLGTTCSYKEREEVKGAVANLGFRLNERDTDLTLSDKVSEPLREYIWRLAEFRKEESLRG